MTNANAPGKERVNYLNAGYGAAPLFATAVELCAAATSVVLDTHTTEAPD